MQSVPNKTDLLGDLDLGLPVCKLWSSLLITWDGENNNNDDLHLECAWDIPGPVLKQPCGTGSVISLLKRSTWRHRKVKSFTQGHSTEVSGLDSSQESGCRAQATWPLV